MRQLRATGLGASVLAASLTAGASQTLVRETRTPDQSPAGTATISGIVVADSGGSPVRLAHIVLIGAVTGTLRVTSSDDAGRFAFENLPPDRYVVGASKPPYLGAVAGARRPARPGTGIVVAPGQRVGNVTIRLPRGAAISGVVTDERGQPAGVNVTAWQVQAPNRDRLREVKSTSTDDRGHYRLHGLPPGEYFVAVESGRGEPAVQPGIRVLRDADVDAALRPSSAASITRQSAVPQPAGPPAAAAPMVYAPVYFPGTTRASDAIPIALSAGDEREADVRLELVKTARVEGVLVRPDGTSPTDLTVRLFPTGPSFPTYFDQGGRRIMPDGRFSFDAVRPGTYTLQAGGIVQRAGEFVTAVIEVAGIDLSGIRLVLQPALSFNARIAFDGATPPPALAGHRIPIRALSAAIASSAAPAFTPTDANGAFSVSGLLPGPYVIGGPLFFGASSDSVTWALQSVTIDGRDVTDLAVEISTDSVPANVVVTFSDRSQELSGRLQNASGGPVSDYTVIVFPAAKSYWLPNSRRILTARPDTDGRFRFGGPGPISLPAGHYFLAAVTDLARDEQFDTRLLEQLVRAAVKVSVQPGERAVQDLVIK